MKIDFKIYLLFGCPWLFAPLNAQTHLDDLNLMHSYCGCKSFFVDENVPASDRPNVLLSDCSPERSVKTLSGMSEESRQVDTAPLHCWALKTNMLYDALLVPNIGIEYAFNQQWSVTANWMYAWWSNNDKHRYWRIYGGELGVRRYLGNKTATRTFTGHHLGLYGQILTYDFELGGTGYKSKFSYGGGVEYGYSIPIARRLNLDFTVGLGYFGGKYEEYEPTDDCYVWQKTTHRHWFGPTKAEISLLWLFGKKSN